MYIKYRQSDQAQSRSDYILKLVSYVRMQELLIFVIIGTESVFQLLLLIERFIGKRINQFTVASLAFSDSLCSCLNFIFKNEAVDNKNSV